MEVDLKGLFDIMYHGTDRIAMERVELKIKKLSSNGPFQFEDLFLALLAEKAVNGEKTSVTAVRLAIQIFSNRNKTKKSQREIAKFLKCREATVCEAIRKLEEAGLLKKNGKEIFLNPFVWKKFKGEEEGEIQEEWRLYGIEQCDKRTCEQNGLNDKNGVSGSNSSNKPKIQRRRSSSKDDKTDKTQSENTTNRTWTNGEVSDSETSDLEEWIRIAEMQEEQYSEE